MNNQAPPPTPNEKRQELKTPADPSYRDARDHNSRQPNPPDPKHQPGHQRQPPGPGQKD